MAPLVPNAQQWSLYCNSTNSLYSNIKTVALKKKTLQLWARWKVDWLPLNASTAFVSLNFTQSVLFSFISGAMIKSSSGRLFVRLFAFIQTLFRRLHGAEQNGRCEGAWHRPGRAFPLHPPPLRRGSQGGSNSDSNHTQQREKGFTQRGVKPNWLCFIARRARGKRRSEECVCRCYGVLRGEALFHNGWRGRAGQNYSVWERRWEHVQGLYGWNPGWGSDGFSPLTGWAPAECNLSKPPQLASIYCTLDLQTPDKLPRWKRAGWRRPAGSRLGLRRP